MKFRRKKENFGKNGEHAKIHQRFGQIFKLHDTKRHVDSWRFLGR